MAILKKFECKGSTGVYYGLGLEKVSIDFSEISGLVTLAGENGTAKTTVMELLSPYDCIKSRQIIEGKKYNLKREFMLRDSYKEVTYFHEGSTYVFRVEIPAGTKSAAPEGFINIFNDEYPDGKPLVKGKISEYRKKVVELFGSETLFYSSIFSCQGGKKLTDKTTGEFKQLLIELLGLNKYSAWWHNAGKAISAVNTELDRVVTSKSHFDEKIDNVEMTNQELARVEFDLDADKQSIETIKSNIVDLETHAETLRSDKVDAEQKNVIISGKKEQIVAVLSEQTIAKHEHEEAESKHKAWLLHNSVEMNQYNLIIEKEEQILNANIKIAEINKEKLALEESVKTIDAGIEKKQTGINEASDSISSWQKSKLATENDQDLKYLFEKLTSAKEGYATAKAEKLEKERGLEKIKDESELRILEQSLSQLNEAETLLKKRPGNCVDDTCPFIMSAALAIKQKPVTDKAIETWKEKHDFAVSYAGKELLFAGTELEKVIAEGVAVREEYKTQETIVSEAVAYIETEISKLTEEKLLIESELSALKDKKSDTTADLDGIPDLIRKNQDLADLKPRLETAKELISTNDIIVSERQVIVSENKDVFDNFMISSTADISAIADEIEELEPKVSIDTILGLINTAEDEIKRAELKESVLSGSIQEAEKRKAVLEDKAKMSDDDQNKIDELNAREKLIRNELSKWEYVRAAVSKSGLQALEIASAAPMLTGIANDLLHSAFGGEFYLDLVTVDPDTGAEILDINVTREDGKTFSLSKYSGGQKVWILQSFKCAQILVNAEKSGIHFATCFCDEESGSLDKKKAERFISMYRAMMEKGSFEKLIYITHIEESQALADHVLNFQNGGIASESNI